MFKAFYFFRYAMLAASLLLFAMCTKDLEGNFGGTERELIINSTFFEGQTFSVELTTSRNILDSSSEIETISNAYVAIKDEAGKVLEVLTEKNGLGIYTSSESLKAFAGSTYNLEVTHPRWRGTSFTATSSVPFLGSESVIDTNTILLSDGLALQIGIIIDDSELEGDTYIFEMELHEDGELAGFEGFGDDVVVYGDQNVPKRLFLGDDTFNGNKMSIDFRTQEGFAADGSQLNTKAEIRMINASAELFEYYKSLEEYQVAQSSIGSVNTSAVSIYSNIKQSGVNKGFGIFAGFNKESLVIK